MSLKGEIVVVDGTGEGGVGLAAALAPEELAELFVEGLAHERQVRLKTIPFVE